ncbi:retrovirus-related pol polyprotein from transposon TNT 1-94 [Tanacetum coccineum]
MITLLQFCGLWDWFKAILQSTGFTTSKGNDLLTGNRGTDLYTISHQENNYHQLQSVSWLTAFTNSSMVMYVKNQLCSSCEVSKAKQSSFKSKTVPSLKGRYTWTLFLRSKDETPEVLKDFLMMIQRNLQALVIFVRTDRGTEFLNKTLNAFFKVEDGENLDKMKEKGDSCILVGYSTLSKGYRVYNPLRTRLIVESIPSDLMRSRDVEKSVAMDTSSSFPNNKRRLI